MTRVLLLTLVLCTPSVHAMRATVESVADYVGVPGDILYAMALVESGMTVDGDYTPWPWTLNVAGEPRRYKNREAMFADLMSVLGEGTLRVDIGPLQLNWYWQYNSTRSPWRMTDPTDNIKQAAQLLKRHYRDCGDWWEAVGRYHRPANSPADKAIAQRYTAQVRANLAASQRRVIADAT